MSYHTVNNSSGLQSGIGDESSNSEHWPASVHIIGWFHTVIWPTMLMSAGVLLPKTIFGHGLVNDSSGQKMSKFLGNVILAKYGSDPFRYFVSRFPYGGEVPFSEASMAQMSNSDLADCLGNYSPSTRLSFYCTPPLPLVGVSIAMERERQRMTVSSTARNYVNRAMNLCEKYSGSKVRDPKKWTIIRHDGPNNLGS